MDESYKKWQYVEMFNIGKAEEIMYFNTMNTYPVNQDRILYNITNSNYDLNNLMIGHLKAFRALITCCTDYQPTKMIL